MNQKNGYRPRRERVPEEQSLNRTQRVVVTSALLHQNLKSTTDFEWPEFTTERERIKANTTRYAGTPIPEIFGTKTVDTQNYDTLRELRVGDTIDVTVKSFTSYGVEFETVATKQVVQSSVNLNKYTKLRSMVPFKAKAVVTRATREIAHIDIIRPIYESWLAEVLKYPEKQRHMHCPKSIQVHNLRLTRGGFIGQASIPTVSEFVGQDYTVEAFIPGSQIVLNIEDDFEKWSGKTVDAFVTNYIPKPGTKSDMSLVCSRKEVLKFYGDMNTVKIFKAYCEGGDTWKAFESHVFDGVVTGIINSSKKCGVFVELPDAYITGMVAVDADKLVNYKPQDRVKVKICSFDENTYYDSVTGQLRHDSPYEIEDDILKSCNVKPVLKFV